MILEAYLINTNDNIITKFTECITYGLHFFTAVHCNTRLIQTIISTSPILYAN